jgi:hypothetical protein
MGSFFTFVTCMLRGGGGHAAAPHRIVLPQAVWGLDFRRNRSLNPPVIFYRGSVGHIQLLISGLSMPSA